MTHTLAHRQLAVAHHLDRGPVSRRRLSVWFLAAAGIGLDGFDLFIMSAAGPLITDDFGLNPAMNGLIVSAAVIGAIPGALLSGFIADKIGRRRMLQIDLFLFVATSILCAIAWEPWILVVFRLLQGAAVGAEYPLSASMVSEVMPRATRGKWVVGAFAFQAVGMVLAAITATSILLLTDNINAWRWMLLAGIVPALIVAVLRLRIPESPRWNASQGNIEEAEKDVEWMTGSIPVVTPEIEAIMAGGMVAPEPSGSMRELWSPGLIRITLLVAIPWFLMDIALYAIGLFTPDLIASLTTSTNNGTFLQKDLQATAASAFTDVFLVIGFLVNILLVERIGRIRLQVVGFLGMALGLGLLASTAGSSATSILPVLLGLVIFDLFVNSGPNATTYLLPAEVYPTRLRATGHGFAAAAGKTGAALGSFFLPVFIDDWGTGFTVGLLAAISLVGAVVTYALRVETRGMALDATPVRPGAAAGAAVPDPA